MNFIDWNNEFEAIGDSGYNWDSTDNDRILIIINNIVSNLFKLKRIAQFLEWKFQFSMKLWLLKL